MHAAPFFYLAVRLTDNWYALQLPDFFIWFSAATSFAGFSGSLAFPKPIATGSELAILCMG